MLASFYLPALSWSLDMESDAFWTTVSTDTQAAVSSHSKVSQILKNVFGSSALTYSAF